MESDDILHPLLENENELQILGKAIQNLKEEQRVCIEMMYLKQMSYKEIMKETGFDLNQVKSHIQNGRRNLKNLMGQNGK